MELAVYDPLQISQLASELKNDNSSLFFFSGTQTQRFSPSLEESEANRYHAYCKKIHHFYQKHAAGIADALQYNNYDWQYIVSFAAALSQDCFFGQYKSSVGIDIIAPRIPVKDRAIFLSLIFQNKIYAEKFRERKENSVFNL